MTQPVCTYLGKEQLSSSFVNISFGSCGDYNSSDFQFSQWLDENSDT